MANKILDHIFASIVYTIPTIYVALANTAIVDDDTGSTIDEFAFTGYERQACEDWDAAASRATENTNDIVYDTFTVGDNKIAAGICLADALTAGNILTYFNPAIPIEVYAQDDVKLVAGAFDITID